MTQEEAGNFFADKTVTKLNDLFFELEKNMVEMINDQEIVAKMVELMR